MKLFLIRHGATKGNMQHRYVGATDEGLHPGSAAALRDTKATMGLPEVLRVYASPMRRCLETAQILFPYSEYIVVEDFRECDFGEFEYLNYEELNGSCAYQQFIDSRGEIGFPGGESITGFQKRCTDSFGKIIADIRDAGTDAVIVAHGGTIMSVLDRYSFPHKSYYDWQVENGGGYEGDIVFSENGELKIKQIMKLGSPR